MRHSERPKYHSQPIRHPREITCKRCGIVFIHRGQGAAQYCIECRDIVITSHSNGITKRIKVGVE